MIISHIILKNWRNFKSVDVQLGDRVILVGPNASGKSNFLDAFRFLRDVAKAGGGLQKAVSERGGISKIRCLAARRDPVVRIEVVFQDSANGKPTWKYIIGVRQEVRGARQPILDYEQVWHDDQIIIERPTPEDERDRLRLTQTFLEQINANASFREIARHLQSVLYLHLIPQLVRHPKEFPGPGIPGDPFGRAFLERVARASKKTRESRLAKIEKALQVAVPQLKQLKHVTDEEEGGVPHLEAVYTHWRPTGAKQREDQFSDGTLRLVGLLWSLLEGESLLLMEEPELSLNAGIVRQLPALIYRLQSSRKRQVILSTHSADLLYDRGISGDEVLVLSPDTEGTLVERASSVRVIRDLLEGGLSLAEAVLPRTVPNDVRQLGLFK
jgi:predicted ATPase